MVLVQYRCLEFLLAIAVVVAVLVAVVMMPDVVVVMLSASGTRAIQSDAPRSNGSGAPQNVSPAEL